MTREVRTPGIPKAEAEQDEAPAAQPKPSKAKPAAQPVSSTGLPNEIDIDAKSISAPVLTNQGWVCPDESGKRVPDSMKA